jgi:hypothetical protein
MDRLKSIRKGQWFRLAGVVVCLLGIILYLALPQIIIQYQLYSNTSTAGTRDYSFPLEYISGVMNFFGNGFFSYYKKSSYGAEVLVAQSASFNYFALAIVLLAVVCCVLDAWLTFTKTHERWSKLATLLFVVCGLMVLGGPIWFLVINNFGAADWTASSYIGTYWLYDSLYVHDAYGAIITSLTFFLAAVLFGVGTSMEGGSRNDNRQE